MGISDLLKEEGDIVPIADIPITVVNSLLFPSPSTKDSKQNDHSVPFSNIMLINKDEDEDDDEDSNEDTY